MNMICLGLEICNYKQLFTVGPQLIRSLEEKLDAVVRQNDISVLRKKGGFYLLNMGEEAEADPKDVLEAAFQLLGAVREFREDLFGYNILLGTHDDKRIQNIEGKFAASFLELLEEEGVWVHNRDTEYFKSHAHFREGDPYSRILQSKKTEPVFNVISYVPQVRQRVIRRLAQVLLKWLTRTLRNPGLLLVTGPADSAKREIVAAALATVIGKERGAILQIVGATDPREPPLAPLLEGMHSTRDRLWKRLPHYLLPHEKPIWKTYENFLLLLLEGKAALGDRTEEDFFIIYNLYLCAYFRLLEELLLPGIVLLHDPHRLPAAIGGRLETLFADVSRRFRLAVVVVSSQPQLPGWCRGLHKVRVAVKPFGQTDIRQCFAALYPGAAVPRRTVAQIERLSRGRYGSVLHYIYYLRLHRKIVHEGNRFAWVPKSACRVKIPAHYRTASVAIIRSLKEEARTILFAALFLGGLLTQAELGEFFSAIGLIVRKAEEQITYLRSLELLPRRERARASAFLRVALRRLAPQKTKYLEEQMREFLQARLERFLPARAARCFRLLATLGAGDLVVEHLAPVINHALDSRQISRAQYFLRPGQYLKLESLSGEKRKRLEYTLFAYRIRSSLLGGDIEAAEREVSRSVLPTESLVPEPVFARLHLELGRYALCQEDLGKALPLFKKAVHNFQELSMTAPSSEAFLELGCGFLAKGNLPEALEYFSFAKKLIQDASSPFIHVRSLWFESVALYLIGNYSRILANCDAAALLSAGHGFREAELRFGFLKARVMFDLGFYERCSLLLRECLCLARLYGRKEARPMLFAWLARAALYQGNTEHALALLRGLEENDENLFIRGEAYFLAGDDKRAEKVFTKAIHSKPAPPHLFPEYNDWKRGFDLVEGRCLELNAHGTPLFRLARAFRAVLLFRAGNLEEAVAELHLLTITDKFAEADPHVFLFHYLYYTILKTLEKKKTSFQEMGHALTILNKALKHLQERATVIDEPRDRIHYLTQNYWNKLIFDEGKTNKLL